MLNIKSPLNLDKNINWRIFDRFKVAQDYMKNNCRNQFIENSFPD